MSGDGAGAGGIPAERSLQDMKDGEVADEARKAGIENVDQMNRSEMVNALESKGEGGGERHD